MSLFGRTLDRLDARHLLRGEQKIGFLVALHGDRIWGREVVFHQVRLIRQDLSEAATSVAHTAAR